jgi:glycosyltransferase involved in cell wall biosynthesis
VSSTVSFVIPCYRLAHLVSECVESILSQTFKDFEILVLDDCSPDNTEHVVKSLTDSRVKHIRNDVNLGHLRNYNKGLQLSAGKYVWLISADDRLRRNDALQRYVDIFEQNPRVGYVFSPAIGLQNGTEKGLVDWTVNGDRDFVFDGNAFARRLVHGNTIAAPSVMARKECYEKVTLFPLDMPYGGDWYLWLAFALRYQVAYVSEPSVDYRLHSQSMTSQIDRSAQIADNIAIRWRIKRMAGDLGDGASVEECDRSIADHYAYCLARETFQDGDYRMSLEDFEASLGRNARTSAEKRAIRARVYEVLGNGFYRKKEIRKAIHYYDLASRERHWMPRLWAKRAFLKALAIKPNSVSSEVDLLNKSAQ